MNFELATLVAMLVAVLVLGARQNAAVRARPGSLYHRMFSFAAAGLLCVVSGLLRWDLSHSREWFRGARQAEAIVRWQVTLGLVLLVVAGIYAHRVSSRVNSRTS